ncbi:MAG: hypothetical protein HY911_14185 [Desulfobacterales bacterium]|nr:hypothetical protein [Desulfobacterales bacterium]
MKPIDCLLERPSKIAVAVALMVITFFLVVIGLTVLPVLGIFLAIPVFFIGMTFFFAPRSQECSIRS